MFMMANLNDIFASTNTAPRCSASLLDIGKHQSFSSDCFSLSSSLRSEEGFPLVEETIFDITPEDNNTNSKCDIESESKKNVLWKKSLDIILGDKLSNEEFLVPSVPLSVEYTGAPQKRRLCIDSSATKRQKRDNPEEEDNIQGPQIRPYQEGQWNSSLLELLDFKKRSGHCHVHYTYKENRGLTKWVQRQRYQFKLMQSGRQSTMTLERIQKLEAIGFAWDAHAAAWEERFNELAKYKQKHGHCCVPAGYTHNIQLATWVKEQRRQFKLFNSGKDSKMSISHIELLSQLGFAWDLRSSSTSIRHIPI